MQNACETTKTIIYEKKHLKNDDKLATWKKRYVLVLKIMNYREKTHLKNNFSINSSKHK